MASIHSLAGKAALVIGGAGGIGAASAKLLAEAGAKLALTHRPGKEAADRAAPLIKALPGEGHIAIPADVANTRTLIAARDQIDRGFGFFNIPVNTEGFTNPIPDGHPDSAQGDS